MTGHRPDAGRFHRLRKMLVYTGRHDVVRRLDRAMSVSVMSSEILGELMQELEDFRKNDPVQHQEVMALVDEILGDLRKAWNR